MGLVYLHSQGIVHGDLNGVRVRTPRSPSRILVHPFQGQRFDRQQGPWPFSRLQPAYDNLGPINNYVLDPGGRHSAMDEPRAHRPGHVRFEEEPSDQGIGLLCFGDDDIRGSQWTGTICPM